MRTCSIVISFVLSMLFFVTTVFCQDSLYLIGTITGKSTTEKIISVKGVGDINGDGYDDFMVSVGYHSTQLYLGSANFNLTPSVVLHFPEKVTANGLGTMAGIGDVNGDGYNDFILGGIYDNGTGGQGNVFLYYGGTKIDTIPKMEFYETWIQDAFGHALQGVGDLNQDGYDDFIISSPYNWSDEKGRAYLFWGGDTISFQRSITFTSDTIMDFFGESVARIGDINGDGYDDLAIGAPKRDSGKVYIYYSENPMHTTPDTILRGKYFGEGFGKIIKRAGDLNKDGIEDFCIGDGYEIYLYLGYSQIQKPIVIKGYSLGAGGDINHDGYDDLIVGFDWKIKAYLGSDKYDTTNCLLIDDPQHSLCFSTNISIVGDINKDGYDEIFAFSPNWPNPDSALGKVYIYSFKKITGVKENNTTVPYKFDLYQNYPNPFNPNTVISYQLPGVGRQYIVSLRVYDILGREVAVLFNGIKEAGSYSSIFDGTRLSNGVYFVRLSVMSQDGSKPFTKTMKMQLIK